MKYISFRREGLPSYGIWEDGRICDIPALSRAFGQTDIPDTLDGLLREFDFYHRKIDEMYSEVDSNHRPELFFPEGQVQMLPPLPSPSSLRIYFGSEEYLQKVSSFYNTGSKDDTSGKPVHFFGNHQSIVAPEADIIPPANAGQLDFEMQIAAVIGRKGKNISRGSATRYLAGLCLINNWIARDIDPSLSGYFLYPPKSFDFGTSLGPYIVSMDELEEVESGGRYSLRMTATVNSDLVLQGNCSDYSFTLSDLIVDASKNCTLHPGDVISMGCLESGSLLGSEKEMWLHPGDVVSLEAEKLGVLKNPIASP